jgi:hypothetical protein
LAEVDIDHEGTEQEGVAQDSGARAFEKLSNLPVAAQLAPSLDEFEGSLDEAAANASREARQHNLRIEDA